MLQLTWLKIHKFRNVKPGTELHFGPKFNVLLGKNASGKTTLLELIVAILNDSVWQHGAEDAQDFELEYRQSSADYTFCVATAVVADEASSTTDEILPNLGIVDRRPKTRTWSVAVTDKQNRPIFACAIQGNSGRFRFGEGEERAFTVDDTSSWNMASAFLMGSEQATSDDEKSVVRPLWLPRVLGVVHNWAPRFDEALGAFERLNVAGPRIGGSPGSFFFPRVITMMLNERLKKDSEDYARPFDFGDVPELARLLPLLGFAKAELRPQLEKRTSNGGTTYEFEGVNLVFGRASGDLIRADLLSFGQKRLLSFYWYLAVRGDLPIVADELANGLHHEWIEACVTELTERQSFLATQNPLLLDYLPAGTPDTTLIHCSTDSTNGHGSMAWRNFSDEEQQRLDDACTVGIQQVSEILRSEGLW